MSFGGLTRSVPDGGEQPRNGGGIGHRSGGRPLSFDIFTRGFGAGSPHHFCRPQNTSFATSHLAAFRSRSWVMPHAVAVQNLTARGFSPGLNLHTERSRLEATSH